jgi:hypothetical protein
MKNIFNLIIVFILILIASSLAYGIYTKEVRGYFIFSLFISGIFCNVVIIFSYFINRRVLQLLKFSWLGIAFCVLFSAIAFVNPNHNDANRDIGLIIGYPMAFLSFPSGPIASISLSYTGSRPSSFYAGNIYDWGVFLIAGYLQWFVLLPFLISKIRNKPD